MLLFVCDSAVNDFEGWILLRCLLNIDNRLLVPSNELSMSSRYLGFDVYVEPTWL